MSSAHDFSAATRADNPSVMAYYIAHAYMQRAERLSQNSARTISEKTKKHYRISFLNEVAKRYIRVSDDLDRLEKEFMRKGI
jgi:hypothetical protein